jgi:hypothetical protein
MIGFGQLNSPRIGFKIGNSFSTVTANLNGLSLEAWNGISEKDKTILKNPGLILGLYTTSKSRSFFINSLSYKIQNELLCHQKGYKYSNIPISYIRERFNYAEMSSNFNLIILEKISLNIGPYWGLLIGGKQLKYNEAGYSSFEYDAFIFRKVDYGMNLGLSLILNETTNINLRYGQGLKNYNEGMNSKHVTYQLSLEYLFSEQQRKK